MSKKLGILIADQYEDRELWYPKIFFEALGVEAQVIGIKTSEFSGKNGSTIKADVEIGAVELNDLDALHIPGGYAPDKMRRSSEMCSLVADAHESGLPVAAICHAGWMLISAGIAEGRKLTGFYSIQDDLRNAGATYVDERVVVDENLITSRHPSDLPYYCNALASAMGFESDDRLV